MVSLTLVPSFRQRLCPLSGGGGCQGGAKLDLASLPAAEEGAELDLTFGHALKEGVAPNLTLLRVVEEGAALELTSRPLDVEETHARLDFATQ